MSLCDFVVDISGEEASSSEEDAEDAVDDVNFVEPEVLAEISVLAGALPVDSAVAAAIGTRACVPLRALFASLLSAGMGGTRIVNEEPAHECRNTQVQNEREKSRGGRDMLFAETPLRPPLLVLPPHAAPHTFLQRRAEARLPASHLQPRAPLLSSGLDSAVRQTSRQKGAAVGRCYDALTLPYFYRRGYAGRRAVARGGSRRNTTFRYCRCRCCCRRHSINVNHGVCCRGDAACRLHHHQRTPMAQ